jgi:hypothetical protein
METKRDQGNETAFARSCGRAMPRGVAHAENFLRTREEKRDTQLP